VKITANNKLDQDPYRIKSIIFSYDRAMQLDANLHSFYLHCTDHELANMTVLYRVSDEKNKAQYMHLADDYPQVRFVQQGDFRDDVINILTTDNARWLSNAYNFFSLIFTISHKNRFFKLFFNRFVRQFLLGFLPYKANQYVLFLVDDNIFIRAFSLRTVIHQLKTQPEALGFSLRLGKNTTYCYALNSAQSIPPFLKLDDNVLVYKWTEAEYDFAYPLEISSSVYRTKQILPLLLRLMFSNPNSLEGAIAAQSFEFKRQYPNLLSFETSVAFCNPINMVQIETRNRAGAQEDYSAQALSEMFEKGQRIDVNHMKNFIPTGCHQEVDLLFTKVPKR
jgi:hypothetical protein